MKRGAPLSVLACPDALCYACDATSREALCVDGALKSEASRECNVVCDPCTEQSCRPCTRRGTCQLRGDFAVCTCNPLSRGLVCESLCPGVTEIFNGPSATLVGPACYGNGVCNDNAVCQCLEDINGQSMFVPETTCQQACPLNNAGLVCSGHGTCQSGLEASCDCDPGWFGPLCSCNDGSTASKTCVHGDCQADGTCACHDDDVLGHWDGPFCSICASNYFTELTFCTQYCNPETTCHGHAGSCVLDPVQIDEATGLAIPCREENGALLGTCARCLCNSNFNSSIQLQATFPEFMDSKSLAYQCGTCKANYYPLVSTKAYDAEDVCQVFCDSSTCNNRGVCLKASGDCVCYGNCPSDQTTYVGTCLQRQGIDIIQPQYEELSSCSSCDPFWGPMLPDWELSCTTYCDASATELSTFPSSCYDSDGFIRSECVFCSGRAENCTSLGLQPVCNCNDGYTGTYCQSTCGSATSNACNNGVCEEDRLANYFDFATPEYQKRSDDSWKCRCDPQDSVTEDERSLYEDSFYTITSFNLDNVAIENLGLPPKPEFYGASCASECKRSLSGDICSGNGNCESVSINQNCSTDADCNSVDDTREDRQLFCYKEQRPKFFQLLRELSNSNLPACRASEVSFVHDFIDTYDWNRFCYDFSFSSVPDELQTSSCRQCNQLIDSEVLWKDIDSKCSELVTFANYENLQALSTDCSSECTMAIASFDWKSFCEFSTTDFGSCSSACRAKLDEVDFVTDAGFCSQLENYTENKALQAEACAPFVDEDLSYGRTSECQAVGSQVDDYEVASSCLVTRESIETPSSVVLLQPYSSSLNAVMCKVSEVCGSIEHVIPFAKRDCDASQLNKDNTGLNDCLLRDAEHEYCSNLYPHGWSDFENDQYVVETYFRHESYVDASETTVLVNAVQSVDGRRLQAGLFVSFGSNYTGILVSECRLKAPKCLYCGNIRNGPEVLSSNKLDSNFNNDPIKCCKSGTFFQEGNASWCRESCDSLRCKEAVKQVDWTSKLEAIDNLKVFDPSISGLSDSEKRQQFDLTAYCDNRFAMDEIVASVHSLEAFETYCREIASLPVTMPYVAAFNDQLSAEDIVLLDALKTSIWQSIRPALSLPLYNEAYFYKDDRAFFATNNYEVSEPGLERRSLSLWIKVPELQDNSYLMSMSLQNAGLGVGYGSFLQIDLRRKAIYLNNERSNLLDSRSGWLHLLVHMNYDTKKADVELESSATLFRYVLNIDFLCMSYGQNCSDTQGNPIYLDNVKLQHPVGSDLIYNDLRLFEGDIQFSYLSYALSPNGPSTIAYTQCPIFLSPPSIAALFCDAGDASCAAKIEATSWSRLCNDYSDAVVLSSDEKTVICNGNAECMQKLERYDFDSFYQSYARNKRPQQSYDAECQSCRSLLDNYNFADACDATLRDVYESCDDCTASFQSWRESFDKTSFCSGLSAAESEIKDVFDAGIANCSAACRDKQSSINFLDFCDTRLSTHGPFAPYVMSHNLSSACRTQVMTSLKNSLEATEYRLDFVRDCQSLATRGTTEPSGVCHKLFCDCTSPDIGGDRCNLLCSVGSDGSVCNRDSGIGKCCEDTGEPLSFATCNTDVVTTEALVAGDCLCFDSVIAGDNCDGVCEKCSEEFGECLPSSGICQCRANPISESLDASDFKLYNQSFSAQNLTFDWANKETDEGDYGGDITQQSEVLLLWSPDATCGDGIDFCCEWSQAFLDSLQNPLQENYEFNRIVLSTETVIAATTSAPTTTEAATTTSAPTTEAATTTEATTTPALTTTEAATTTEATTTSAPTTTEASTTSAPTTTEASNDLGSDNNRSQHDRSHNN